jgi:hypothetical protein
VIFTNMVQYIIHENFFFRIPRANLLQIGIAKIVKKNQKKWNIKKKIIKQNMKQKKTQKTHDEHFRTGKELLGS